VALVTFIGRPKPQEKERQSQATDCKGWGCGAERGEALAVRCGSG